MEAESVSSLSPLLQAADQWGEVLLLLPLLVGLEAVLSADNAIALAAISRRLHNPERQRLALNIGLLLALVFRLLLILAARWVLQLWPLQLLASAYLLWLCGRQLLGGGSEASTSGDDAEPTVPAIDGAAEASNPAAMAAALVPTQPVGWSAHQATASLTGSDDRGRTAPGQAPPPPEPSQTSASSGGPLWRPLTGVILTLAVTDLAFSLDSVAAAVAVTDRLGLVMAGGIIGVIALRLTAELFIRWLEIFRHLETAGYLAVGLVGVRLLLRVLLPSLVLPEWSLLLLVASLFAWGFSERLDPPGGAEPKDEPQA